MVVDIGCNPLYGPNFQNVFHEIKFRKAKRHYCKWTKMTSTNVGIRGTGRSACQHFFGNLGISIAFW